MKAVRLTGPRSLEYGDAEDPMPDGMSVIIKVASCGICGSDLHYWAAGVGMNGLPGLIMGHEFAGVVAHPGGRRDLEPGMRVIAIPLNPCGECGPCVQGSPQMCANGLSRPNIGLSSPGAYAEYVSVRPDMVRRLPDSVGDLEAPMIEPASVSFHAVRTAGVRAGDAVLVVGSGAIGLLCAAWARISGASRVYLAEVNDARAATAMRLGDADEVLDARDPKWVSRLRKATSGGPDVAIDASGSDAGINAALMALKVQGTLVLAGISLTPQSLLTLALTGRELTLKGSFAYTVPDFETTMDFVARGILPVEKYVSRAVRLPEVQEACAALHSGSSGDVKIVIRP